LTIPPSNPAGAATTVLVVAIAAVWDVRTRRIPNALTFPAMGAGILLSGLADGWIGLLAALAGAAAAPAVLLALRLGKRLGMGDLKLAMAVGALTGPLVGGLAMLLATLSGGFLAILWMFRPGTAAAKNWSPFLVGVPILGKKYSAASPDDEPVATVTIPYGVAIGIGAVLAVAAAGTR